MKKYFNNALRTSLLLTTLLVTGCTYQTLDQNDIKNAGLLCKEKGGIFEMQEFWDRGTYVMCKNGEEIDIDKITGN